MKKTPIVLLVILVVLAACAPAAFDSVAPSTQPTIKEPPLEALTQVLGKTFPQALSTLFWVLVISVLVAVVVAYGPRVVASMADEGLVRPVRRSTIFLGWLVTTLVGMGVFFGPGSMVTIPQDMRGVHLRFGRATGQILQPGLHVITPWSDQVALISVREFVYITTTHVDTASEDFPDYTVGARTCDGVEVQIPYTIKFKANPDRVVDLYEKYGSIVAAMERVVKVESRQIVRDIPTAYSSIAMYASVAVTTNPEMVTDPELREILKYASCGEASLGFDALNEEIRAQLADRFALNGLELTFFGIRQPDLGAFGEKLDAVRQRAQDVRVAEQSALKAEQDAKAAENAARGQANANKVLTETAAVAEANALLTQTKAEASKVTIKADADALATVTRATADAKARILTADADAQANRALAASLTAELVEYQAMLKYYSTWSGNYPYLYGGGNPLPIMQVPLLAQPE